MVHIHLGLYGAFTELTAPLPEPVGQVRLRIESEETGTDLRGPTACELYHPTDLDALIARLGPDPLRRDADPERAWAAISRSSRPIGALLMDQKVIAGIGNVYRAEVLFRAGIDPMRPGNRLLRSEFDEMWHDLVALMKVGVRRGGRIHVVRPEDDHGAPSYAANRPRTYVYRRAGGSRVASAVHRSCSPNSMRARSIGAPSARRDATPSRKARQTSVISREDRGGRAPHAETGGEVCR